MRVGWGGREALGLERAERRESGARGWGFCSLLSLDSQVFRLKAIRFWQCKGSCYVDKDIFINLLINLLSI